MKMFPSVTEVIAPWQDFSRIPLDVLEAAAERGTAVHRACSQIAQGLPWQEDEQTAGYVQSFRRWFDAVVAEVVLVEERLFDDRLGFNGQIDLLVRDKAGKLILGDLKTPLILSKSWRVQLAAYRHLCELAGYTPDRSGTLRLDRAGNVPKMDYYENQTSDFNIFLSCLNAKRFFI